MAVHFWKSDSKRTMMVMARVQLSLNNSTDLYRKKRQWHGHELLSLLSLDSSGIGIDQL